MLEYVQTCFGKNNVRCYALQVKMISGGQIRKTVNVHEKDLLGLPLWKTDGRQYLICPSRQYSLTCEYYWFNVRDNTNFLQS